MSGYGSDVSCLNSLVTGRIVRGSALVVEALYRRLITPRGMLGGGDDESAYGFDVSGYVGAVGYPAALASLPAQVRNECLKDDRVGSVLVTATTTENEDGTQEILLDVSGILEDESETFQFSVGVSDVTTRFLGGIS